MILHVTFPRLICYRKFLNTEPFLKEDNFGKCYCKHIHKRTQLGMNYVKDNTIVLSKGR